MSSTSLDKRQWDSTWDGLPREIRLLIFEALMQDGCTLASLATVSREWQTELERYNFARIKLTPTRIMDFGSMIYRNRALVRYIWFCLEFNDYDCDACGYRHTDYDRFAMTNNGPILTVLENLFSVLSTWDPNSELILDISVYSPSDSKHWFKYLTFMPDTTSDILGGSGIEQMIVNQVYHDRPHGWIAGYRCDAPPMVAIHKVFHGIMKEGPFNDRKSEYQWWDQLPLVPAVTSILLRQQSRRRWKPDSLAHMFARFPRLQEVHYEPWREWDDFFSEINTDERYLYLMGAIPHFNTNLKRLVLFENFNQQYPVIVGEWFRGMVGFSTDHKPSPEISQKVALASLKLEHLAASFVVDASHFFMIEPAWEWPNLTSLAITSKLLTPNEDPVKIGSMLQAAAEAAMKMPQLETMEIWNGKKGLAALFRYHVSGDGQQAIITWRGTWELTLEPSTIKAWEAVANQHGDWWRLSLVQEWLDKADIKSHGDAIHHLRLLNQVIRPISLQQIRREQKALEGVETLDLD